jgi:hypothetical protein
MSSSPCSTGLYGPRRPHLYRDLAVAAGSRLHVVIELLAVGRRIAVKEITTNAPSSGKLLGFATDAIVTAGS